MITVYLEDHGQDFLEWDIEDGVVVDCRPFQGWLWKGAKVHNTNIQPGDLLEITRSLKTSFPAGGRLILKYPVERVRMGIYKHCNLCYTGDLE